MIHLAAQGSVLPGYVEQEFEDYLKCGRLEHGFLQVRCDSCHAEHLAVLLPQMGSATVEGRIEMSEKVIINIKTFDDGHRPPGLVVPAML